MSQKEQVLNLLNEAKYCESFIDLIEHYKNIKIDPEIPNKT